MDEDTLKSIGILALCFLAVVITFFTIAGIRHFAMPEANAKPVTTEVPEYVAKCSKHETTRNTCIEFTIYRVTRN